MESKQPSFVESKVFRGILYGLGIAVVLALAFEAGVFMGYQKAMFSSSWAQNYRDNFMPRPQMHFFNQTQQVDRDFMSPHGAFGDIISLGGSSIIVKGNDEAEKTILIGKDTMIERGDDVIKVSDLLAGNHVIIFGSPNSSGQVEAKVIRVLPPDVVSFAH